MNKVRVYEVARELGLDNRELVNKIATMGIQVRNHMSILDASDVDRLKRHLEKEKAENIVTEKIRPTVVRRRTVVKPAAAVAPAPAAPVARAPAVEHDDEDNGRGVATVAIPPPARITEERAVVERAREQEREPEPVHARADEEPVEEHEASAPAAVAAAQAGRAAAAAPGPQTSMRRSTPPPASERLGHAHLPPGVVARGSSTAPSAPALSATTVSRIVSEHAQSRPAFPGGGGTSDAPRRRELGRAALGPTGRQVGRPHRKKAPPGKKGLKPEITTPSAQKRLIRIEDQVGLQMLASRMSLKATEVLMKLMTLGMTGVNINSTLDADTAKILASEFGYEVENVARTDDEMRTEARGAFADSDTDRIVRPPVVTVMGHVDHGKTSLLDRIRSAKVAEGEAGGITQHIGAHRVETPRGTIVFLDTPGHEAFTAMRARGAQVTDVVILVVAADDGVMPQTREAIHHAKAAGVPIIVAVNKIDLPDARPEVVKRELANEGLQPEEWGGETIFVEVSAKSGQGIDTLLESVALQSEILELTGNAAIPAEGTVLEAYIDKGRGPVANVLVKDGSLRAGDIVVAGSAWGKVRAMTDDRGKPVTVAGPATPIEVLGLNEVPSAGDTIFVVTDARKAQEIAEGKRKKVVQKPTPGHGRTGLEQIQQMMAAGEVAELRLVIKADVQGSVEAFEKAMTELSTEKVRVAVIHTGVGGITENDVMLASASKAIIIGFNVRPAGGAAATSKSENVDMRLYSVIYEAVDEVKKAMAGLLAPTFVEKQLGTAEVRQVFTIPKLGTIGGCYVTEGKILRTAKVRLVRDSVKVWEGAIHSLRRFKDDAREVTSGFECGVSLEGYNDLHERDVIECFEMEAVAAVL